MKQILKRMAAFSASLALSLSSLAIIAVPSAHAASYTYDGGTVRGQEAACNVDHAFSNGDCWVLGAAPSTGTPHNITIDATIPSTERTINNNLVGLQINTLTFSGAFGANSVALTGQSLLIKGTGITNNSSGTVTNPHTIANALDFDGTTPGVSINNGTNADTALTISGGITITGAPTILTISSAVVTDPLGDTSEVRLTGAISGGGSVVIASGITWFTGSNTYTGTTTVNSTGSLVLSASTAGDPTDANGVTVQSGGAVKFVGSISATGDDEVFTIAGFGNDQFDSGVGALITGAFNATLTDVTLSADAGICSTGGANTFDIASPTLGGNTLYKMDSVECPGTETVDTAQTLDEYTGGGGGGPANCPTGPSSCPSATNGMTIAAGDGAKLDSDISGPITVDGTLYGGGFTITGDVNISATGTLSPGLSPGCIIIVGNLTFVSGSSYDVEVGGATACTGYDQTQVTGAVDVTGATLNTSIYNSFDTSTLTAGDELVIIDNDVADAVTGTFSGLAEGATVAIGTGDFTLSYIGGDGNDVTLTYTGETVVTLPVTGPAPAAAAATPGTPDTGFAALMTNPAMIMFSTTSIAGAILAIARKYNLLKV